MKNFISIPKPCHEDWDQMIAAEKGRHCMACEKMVIDFSKWSNDEILTYISSQSSERVCGRFNTTQVVPEAKEKQVLPLVFKSNISLLKKIAAIILLCFGVMSGDTAHAQKITGEVKCTTDTTASYMMGDVLTTETDSTKNTPATIVDTSYTPQIMGMIAPYKPPVADKKKKTKTKTKK